MLLIAALLGAGPSVSPVNGAARKSTKTTKSPARTASKGAAATGRTTVPKADTLRWEPCLSDVECAFLAVPIDRNDPAGPTTTIAIGRVRARSLATRRGVLFVNPGGPGGSAISLVSSIAKGRLDPAQSLGFDDWDVIGVDPRGVGRSAPIRCGAGAADLGINPFDAGDATTRAATRTAWRTTCLAQTGPLFAHAGTIDAADDIDRVRAALGETQIDYLGYSYGTAIGAVYANRYGPRVRSMVLDAAVNPATYGRAFVVDEAIAREKRLADFAASCGQSNRCAYRSAAHDSPDAIRAAVGQNLATIAAKGSPELAITVVSVLSRYLEVSSNWESAAAYLVSVDNAVKSGQLTTIPSNQAVEILQSSPVFWAANCSDGAYPIQASEFDAAVDQIRSNAPIMGGVLLSLLDLCVDWPTPVPLGSIASQAVNPIMVIGGTDDSRTPMVWSSGLVSALGNAFLVTRTGDGHGSIPRSSCVRGLVDAFFRDGSRPAQNAAACPS